MPDETVTGTAALPDAASRPRMAAREPVAPVAAGPEHRIAEAAQALAAEIRSARAAGYRVEFGFSIEALDSIAIGATAKVAAEG